MADLLLVILLVPLVASAVLVAVTFLLAWWVFPGGGSRGPHDTLASRTVGVILVVIAEWLASAWVLVCMPFWRRRPGISRRRLPEGRNPVALLPGFLENPTTMWLLAWRLERGLGVPVRCLVPGNYFAGIDSQAHDYVKQLENFAQQTGAKQVDLVGHSLGGLMARYMVESGLVPGKVGSVITVAAPHLGSALARLVPGRSMRQMRRGSAFLEEQNAKQAPQGIRVVGLSSTHDNLVIPWNCALSPRGDNFIIRYRGHVTMILSTEVARIIARELRA